MSGEREEGSLYHDSNKSSSLITVEEIKMYKIDIKGGFSTHKAEVRDSQGLGPSEFRVVKQSPDPVSFPKLNKKAKRKETQQELE